MKLLYYSEALNKYFDSEAECKAQEKKLEEKKAADAKLKEARAERAKEVEAKFKQAYDAYAEANKALEEFCADYGSFHTSIQAKPGELTPNLFDYLFYNLF